jgi:hypothetical protein
MTLTRDQITSLIAQLQVQSELNPTQHTALMKQAAEVLTELLVLVVAHKLLNREQEKPS